jgi:hypothetical protein
MNAKAIRPLFPSDLGRSHPGGGRRADQVEGGVLRVDRDGLPVDWGGRLGTGRHAWSEVVVQIGSPAIALLALWLARAARSRGTEPASGAAARVLRLLALLLPGTRP